MKTMTRWWRATVAGVVASAGGYAVFVSPDLEAYGQQPAAVKSAPVAPANLTWTRSSSPLSPAAAASTPIPPTPGAVVPASAVLPAAQPPLPPLPALPAGPPMPVPPATVVPPAVPVAPPLPAAVTPVTPVPLPVPGVTPPAPPAKSALPAQPAAPAKAESPLRLPDNGNSVKTDAAWKTSTVAPPPRETTPAAPTVRVTDRAKPPEVAVPPSERDVFPLPATASPEPMIAAPPAIPAVPVAVPPPAPVPMPVIIPAVPPPSPPTNPVATTPGADPMTFKSTAAAALLGGALAMPTAKADAPTGGMTEAQGGKDTPKTTDEKLSDISRALNRLTELLDGKRDEKGYPLPSDPGLAKQVSDLKNDLAALKRQVDAMSSTSQRPTGGAGAAPGGTIPGVPSPMPGAAADPSAPKGTVRVVNEYPIEITMVVNARSYRVSPNATVDIAIPAGDFSYQLLSAGTALAPTRSTIRDREVVTLRIK